MNPLLTKNWWRKQRLLNGLLWIPALGCGFLGCQSEGIRWQIVLDRQLRWLTTTNTDNLNTDRWTARCHVSSISHNGRHMPWKKVATNQNRTYIIIYSTWSISSIDRVEPKVVPFSWGRYHRHFPMDKCGRWWCSGRTWPWFPHRFLSNIFAKWDLSHALFWNEFAIRLWFHCLVQKKYSCCPVHNWKKSCSLLFAFACVFVAQCATVTVICADLHGNGPTAGFFNFFSVLRAHVEWKTLGTPFHVQMAVLV